jgi:hypothetical protein
VFKNVLEECTVSKFRIEGETFPENDDNYPQDYTASQPRRPQLASSPL